MHRLAILGLSVMLIAPFGCEKKEKKTAQTGGTEGGRLTGTPTGTEGGTTLAASDRDFIDKAAAGGNLEVKLGQIASEKATDPRVKAFGQRMVTDHGRANDELQQLAQRKGMALSKELDPRHQQTVDRLSGMSGREFDRAYMDDMVRDHEKDVQEFRNEADQGQDVDLKNWARTTLTTLEDHLKQAKETQKSLTGGGATTQPQETGEETATKPAGE